MIEILTHVEKNLLPLLQTATLNSMYIDYHKPYVRRIWFQHGAYGVFIHRIEPCSGSAEALYHPHQWKSAVRILSGSYEMGVGHSSTTEIPKTDCKLHLGRGAMYEMTEPDGWHYVSPLGLPVYSLMVTGEKTNRPMPIDPPKEFRKLTQDECFNMIAELNNYYVLMLSVKEIKEIVKKISK